MRHKLFTALLARILKAKTEIEINQICGDINTLCQKEKITALDEDLLYRVINATNDNRR